MTHTTHSLEELSIKLQEHTSNTDMTDVQFIKMLQIIDHYTTTKINEVFTEVIKEAKDRLGEGSPMVGVEEVERVFSQKLSQIRKANDE